MVFFKLDDWTLFGREIRSHFHSGQTEFMGDRVLFKSISRILPNLEAVLVRLRQSGRNLVIDHE